MSKYLIQSEDYAETLTLLEQIDEVVSLEPKANHPQYLEASLALSLFTEEVRKTLHGLEGSLASKSHLRVLASQLEGHLNGELQLYREGRDAGHLTNVADNLEACLNKLAMLKPFSANTSANDDQSELASQKSLNTYIETVEARLAEALEQIGAAEELHKNVKDQAEANKTTLTETNTQLSDTLQEFEDQFGQAQTDRQERFESEWGTAQSNLNTKVDEEVKSAKGAFDTLAKELKDQQAGFLTGLGTVEQDAKSTLEKIEQLFKVAGNKAISGSWTESASHERSQAIWDKRYSVSFAALTIGWLLFIFFCNPLATSTGTVDWGHAVPSFGITLIGLGLSGFFARQARFHKEVAKFERHLALSLTALEPFINDLEDNEQREIRKSLVKDFFRVHLEEDKEDLLSNIGPEQLESLTNLISALKK